MSIRAKVILSAIIVLCIISTVYFFVPRRIIADFNNSSIVFDEVIITKSYFDTVEKIPRLDDYKVTNQEDISNIRNMLHDIRITPLLLRNNNLPGDYYAINFLNLKEQRKSKVWITGLSFVVTDFKVYKLKNRDAAEKLTTYIENLINSSK